MNPSPRLIPAAVQTQAAAGPTEQHAKTRRYIKAEGAEGGKGSSAQRYLASLGPSSRRVGNWMLTEMGTIWKRHPVKDGSRLAWHHISAGAIDRIREVLVAKYAPATGNHMLITLRKVLWFCWRDRLLAYEDYLRHAAVDSIRGEAPVRGRALTRAELDNLYAVCSADATPAGLRDGLAIALMHAAGLRSAEAAWLRLEDVMDEDAGELLVPGKGGTLSGASLGEAAGWLTAWFAIRGRKPGPVLYQVRGNGKVVPVGLCAAAMWQIVKKRSVEAKIRRCSPHDLRKTHATAMLRAGCDYLMVMRSLRHRDIRSVALYDRRPDEERAAAQRRAIRAPGPGR